MKYKDTKGTQTYNKKHFYLLYPTRYAGIYKSLILTRPPNVLILFYLLYHPGVCRRKYFFSIFDYKQPFRFESNGGDAAADPTLPAAVTSTEPEEMDLEGCVDGDPGEALDESDEEEALYTGEDIE